jgi:hypothetical protein
MKKATAPAANGRSSGVRKKKSTRTGASSIKEDPTKTGTERAIGAEMASDMRNSPIVNPNAPPASPQLVQHPSGANLLLAMMVDMDANLANSLCEKIADAVIARLDARVAAARAGIQPFANTQAPTQQPKADETKAG